MLTNAQSILHDPCLVSFTLVSLVVTGFASLSVFILKLGYASCNLIWKYVI